MYAAAPLKPVRRNTTTPFLTLPKLTLVSASWTSKVHRGARGVSDRSGLSTSEKAGRYAEAALAMAAAA
jgi:hypothetical protein